MDKDLEWLARNVTKWKSGYDYIAKRVNCEEIFFETVENANYEQHNHFYGVRYSSGKWKEARRELGLDKSLDTATPSEWDAASKAVGWGQPTEEEEEAFNEMEKKMSNVSDGSTASYYELPEGCSELQDLISHRNMNAQDGEIFRAIYRKGRASHSDELRDARKVLFYAEAEVKRLEKLFIG